MKKYLTLFIISFLFTFLPARSETQIFLVDCSGSMFGYGYEMANFGNIFYKARNAMAEHIKELPDSVKAIVVPFCNDLGTPITGSNTEVAEKALSLNYGGSASDISLVWEKAQKFKTTGNTIFFLVTDGFDNWGGVDDLDNYAQSYSANAKDNEITYFYLATDRMKESALAKKFLELPHLDVTTTFDVDPFYIEPEPEQLQEPEPDPESPEKQSLLPEPVKEKKNTFDLGKYVQEYGYYFLWGLLLLIIIAIVVYAIYKLKNRVSIGKVVPSGDDDINKEERTIRAIVKDKFPRDCVVNAERIFEKYNLPLSRLYKFIEEANKYNKIPKPSKDSNVDFTGCAYPLGEAMSKVELAKRLKERNWDITPNNIRKLHYEEATDQFSKILKTTPKAAGEIIGALDLAIHQSADGKYQLVPNNLHRFQELYKHKGLVSVRMKELTGEDYDDSNDEE